VRMDFEENPLEASSPHPSGTLSAGENGVHARYERRGRPCRRKLTKRTKLSPAGR
jgi:hypothetical protein